MERAMKEDLLRTLGEADDVGDSKGKHDRDASMRRAKRPSADANIFRLLSCRYSRLPGAPRIPSAMETMMETRTT